MTPGAAASTKAKLTATTKRRKRAAVIAKRMPLVNYPVTDKIADWSKWPDGLMSRAARGAPVDPGKFPRLRG